MPQEIRYEEDEAQRLARKPQEGVISDDLNATKNSDFDGGLAFYTKEIRRRAVSTTGDTGTDTNDQREKGIDSMQLPGQVRRGGRAKRQEPLLTEQEGGKGKLEASSDLVACYFQSMEHPLLSKEEEGKAAQEIRSAAHVWHQSMFVHCPLVRSNFVQILSSMQEKPSPKAPFRNMKTSKHAKQRAAIVARALPVVTYFVSKMKKRDAFARKNPQHTGDVRREQLKSAATLSRLAEVVKTDDAWFRDQVNRLRDVLHRMTELREDGDTNGVEQYVALVQQQPEELSVAIDEIAKVQAVWEERKNHLVRHNLRYGIAEAKGHCARARNSSFLDFIQEASVGLMRAAELFEWQRGFKFSTFAKYWIRKSLMNVTYDSSRTIRVPRHLQQKISSAEKKYAQVHGRKPTIEELAATMGMDVPKVQKLITFRSGQSSINSPLDGSNDADVESFGSTMEDCSEPKPGQLSDAKDLASTISSMLENKLNYRTRSIIQMRFGFGDGHMYSAVEIGKVFHITRERVAQVERKAKAFLAQIATQLGLHEYLILCEQEHPHNTEFSFLSIQKEEMPPDSPVQCRNILEAIECGTANFWEPDPEILGEPTTEVAGSDGKIEVLRSRIIEGRPLWHPRDNILKKEPKE